jgi:hypothetical protein
MRENRDRHSVPCELGLKCRLVELRVADGKVLSDAACIIAMKRRRVTRMSAMSTSLAKRKRELRMVCHQESSACKENRGSSYGKRKGVPRF